MNNPPSIRHKGVGVTLPRADESYQGDLFCFPDGQLAYFDGAEWINIAEPTEINRLLLKLQTLLDRWESLQCTSSVYQTPIMDLKELLAEYHIEELIGVK